MWRRSLNVLAIFCAVSFSGCAFHDTTAVWPERRPLARDLQTFEPSREPSLAAPPSGIAEDPTGKLTLRRALELALLHNPELAAFSWEVRAGEARALQAGFFPTGCAGCCSPSPPRSVSSPCRGSPCSTVWSW